MEVHSLARSRAKTMYAMRRYKGKSLIDWAVLWFKMSNDAFFRLYGFNFNPFDYPYFIHDSYDFSDAINHFDCTKATDTKSFPENTKTRAFAKGLIALRKTTDAFNFKSKADVDARVTLLTVPGTNNITQEYLVLGYQTVAFNGTVTLSMSMLIASLVSLI